MQRKKIVGIIPSRLNSKRFPRKAFAQIFNMPMIGHVYKRAAMCKDLDYVVIATPDIEIQQYSKKFLKANVIMTPPQHDNPIESSAYALVEFQRQINETFDIAVVISGDEPMITNDMIANAISPFYIDDTIRISCLMCEITTDEEFRDPNEIKVVVDNNNFALYFSREPIPSHFKQKIGIPPLKKVNVMPFDAQFLVEFIQLPPGTLEQIEEIYLLRALEYGYKVKMIMNEQVTYSVDTPADLEKVKQAMKNDYLIKRYLADVN